MEIGNCFRPNDNVLIWRPSKEGCHYTPPCHNINPIPRPELIEPMKKANGCCPISGRSGPLAFTLWLPTGLLIHLLLQAPAGHRNTPANNNAIMSFSIFPFFLEPPALTYLCRLSLVKTKDWHERDPSMRRDCCTILG